ncbi:MAG: PEP-CTERM sorting domain-containing protein [Planctomycetota bacterium]
MFRCIASSTGSHAHAALAVAGLSLTGFAQAEVVEFAGFEVDIDATVGTGQNSSVLVIDWDIYGGPYNTPSHAFLYNWDGEQTLLDMLTAFQNAGVFTFTGTAFIGQISYTDGDGDSHANSTPFNWELASGTNPFGEWTGFDANNPDWDFNAAGADEEIIADGQFEAINAAFFDFDVETQILTRIGTPISVPIVPEPASLTMLGLASLLLYRRRR